MFIACLNWIDFNLFSQPHCKAFQRAC